MNYTLLRSKRKTLSISIANGKVTVKAPLSASEEYIREFIDKKSGWINKKLAEHEKKTAFLGGVLDYTRALYLGVPYDILVTDKVKRVAIDGAAMLLPVKYGDGDLRIKPIAAVYKREAIKLLSARLYELSQATGMDYKSFRLTNAKGKWGSCDSDCNIMLNWRLIMIEPQLIDYVIVHELSHTVHHDHSAAFWKCVCEFYPDYKLARKKLKTYSALTLLYR